MYVIFCPSYPHATPPTFSHLPPHPLHSSKLHQPCSLLLQQLPQQYCTIGKKFISYTSIYLLLHIHYIKTSYHRVLNTTWIFIAILLLTNIHISLYYYSGQFKEPNWKYKEYAPIFSHHCKKRKRWIHQIFKIYVTSLSVFHTEATVSIGLKNLLRMVTFYKIRCLCCEAELVKRKLSLFFVSSQHKQDRKYYALASSALTTGQNWYDTWKSLVFPINCIIYRKLPFI